MNDTALVQKVWNYAHVLRDQGVPYQAYIDLTTTACRAFNERTPDAPTVRYFSVAGRIDASGASCSACSGAITRGAASLTAPVLN